MLSTVALLCILVVAVVGVTLVALLFVGWFALAIPAFAAAAVYLYQLTIRSATSYEGRVVAREIGAGVLAIATGFGIWVGAMVAGLLTGVIPLFSDVEGYPYADAWDTGSIIIAILVVPVAWWLLRRLADPESRTRPE